MAQHSDCPMNRAAGRRLRLGSGLDMLESWSATASQAHRNVVYRALFAVVEGSVYRAFQTLSHPEPAGQVTIYCRRELAVTVRYVGADTFDIVHIGPPPAAPDRRR